MTNDELDAVVARAKEQTECGFMCAVIAMEDIPALVADNKRLEAEVQRLREQQDRGDE